MTKALFLTTLIFAAALLASGCGVEKEKPIISYERNAISVPKLKTVDKKGLYVLFPGNGITPLQAVYLHPGDQYGFQPNDGRVAGFYIQSGTGNFVPLDGVLSSEYVWKYEGDKQP
ncbi:MAG TPA: hypothetical protein VFC46_12810 [Humisphaera sp.]|nr:hypothetical protein [Humisphaera sp.]